MLTSDGLEFVNRGAELRYLLNCLNKRNDLPSLVVIRAPHGFGKSSLTDILSNAGQAHSLDFCIVDPSIRGKAGLAIVYDGFFLQRIAEKLSQMADSHLVVWPSLGSFLKERRMTSVATKDKKDILSELPSLKHGYKVLYDYAARAFSFGRFSPEKLLSSDSADAIAICTAYAEYILETYPVVLVLREVQHIDLHSLRSILLLSESLPGPDLILEYTSESNQFEPEHQKLILQLAAKRQDLELLDLVQLEANHLEYLIRQNVTSDFKLSSDYYLSWNGNLRSVVEMKFQTGVARHLTSKTQVVQALSNLTDSVIDHIASLSTDESIVLAIVLSNVESIDLTTVCSVVSRINPRTSQTQIARSISTLENTHSFLKVAAESISIRSDTVALAVRKVPIMLSKIALAETALRDFYKKSLESRGFESKGLSLALRQYFRLCAQTKDRVGLYAAISLLTEEIRNAQDQTMYIEVVTSAIDANPELYINGHDELIEWAAEVAYDVSDWARAEKLMKMKGHQNAYSRLMRACALQEIGKHEEALSLIATVRQGKVSLQSLLAANLVEALIFGVQGEHKKTRYLLNEVINDELYSESALVGYAYRFFEIVDGIEDGLQKLMASIDWFDKHELYKSKAYSQLPAAILLARSGDISGARKLIVEAREYLSNEVRDQHIILNNHCAVELLSDNPDLLSCRDELIYALRFVSDDFSELTILTNLGLIYLGLNELDESEDCANKCLAILIHHDFADTDIYWPVCFNISIIFEALGKGLKRNEMLNYPYENARPRTDDLAYWNYRFGSSKNFPESHQFLASRRWHPVYLSHWLIDTEGLNLLKIEQR